MSPWFYGTIPEQEAWEILIKKGKPGDYLVRKYCDDFVYFVFSMEEYQ